MWLAVPILLVDPSFHCINDQKFRLVLYFTSWNIFWRQSSRVTLQNTNTFRMPGSQNGLVESCFHSPIQYILVWHYSDLLPRWIFYFFLWNMATYSGTSPIIYSSAHQHRSVFATYFLVILTQMVSETHVFTLLSGIMLGQGHGILSIRAVWLDCTWSWGPSYPHGSAGMLPFLPVLYSQWDRYFNNVVLEIGLYLNCIV